MNSMTSLNFLAPGPGQARSYLTYFYKRKYGPFLTSFRHQRGTGVSMGVSIFHVFYQTQIRAVCYVLLTFSGVFTSPARATWLVIEELSHTECILVWCVYPPVKFPRFTGALWDHPRPCLCQLLFVALHDQ